MRPSDIVGIDGEGIRRGGEGHGGGCFADDLVHGYGRAWANEISSSSLPPIYDLEFYYYDGGLSLPSSTTVVEFNSDDTYSNASEIFERYGGKATRQLGRAQLSMYDE